MAPKSPALSENPATKLDWNYIQVDPEILEFDPTQPRRPVADDVVQEMTRTLDDLGMMHAPLVNADGKSIITGEIRVLGARELGWKDLWVRCATREVTQDECLLLQVAENAQRHDLSEAEVVALLPRVREVLRRTGSYEFSDSKVPPKIGRPSEPGSTHDIARLMRRSQSWVVDHLPEGERVSGALRPMVTASRISRQAALDIDTNCPSEHREYLVKHLEAATPAGFIETGAVRAVVEGLNVIGDDQLLGKKVTNCLTIRAETKQTKADVQVVIAKTLGLKAKLKLHPLSFDKVLESQMLNTARSLRKCNHELPTSDCRAAAKALIVDLRKSMPSGGESQDSARSRPAPVPPVEREAELTDLEREVLYILRKVRKIFSSEEVLTLIKEEPPCGLDMLLNNLRYRGYLDGDIIAGWRAR